MKQSVECLGCGSRRTVSAGQRARLDAGECPRCGYVGWAPSNALNESVRRRIRQHPIERRGSLHAV